MHQWLPSLENRPGNWKVWAMAHENGGRKKWTTRVFAKPLKPCIGGHGQWKSSREPKNVCYSPWKWADNMKNMTFGDATQTMYRSSRSLEIAPWTKNYALYSTKMGKKYEKGEFGRCPSNHVSVVTVAGNCPLNKKLCAIAHENHGKREFWQH
jgi:hypothetical protein